MTDTPASTEAMTALADWHGYITTDPTTGEQKCFGCDHVYDEATTEAAVGHLTAVWRAAGLLTTPAPAPRVLVDEADLRAVPLRDRLTEQEREDIEWAMEQQHAFSPDPSAPTYLRLRAALSAASPGGEQ